MSLPLYEPKFMSLPVLNHVLALTVLTVMLPNKDARNSHRSLLSFLGAEHQPCLHTLKTCFFAVIKSQAQSPLDWLKR